jgi:hypothetical protein
MRGSTCRPRRHVEGYPASTVRTNASTDGSPGSMKWPPSTNSVLEPGITAAIRSVTRRKGSGESLPVTRSVGTEMRPRSDSVASSQETAKLRDDRRPVVDEHLLRARREGLPGLVAEHLAQEGLGHRTRVAGVRLLHLAAERVAPGHRFRVQREGGGLEQHERADELGVAQRELDRRLATVAPTDHDGGRGVQRADERRGILCVLDHARLVRLGTLAAGAASSVVHDHAPELPELVDGRGAPHHRRRRGPVDAQDRVAVPVLLEVQANAVDADLGHARTLPSRIRTCQASMGPPEGFRCFGTTNRA